ncbi:MAG: hypothetical protein HFH24_11090 [Ruminococcus sp.]|nr:hypothetical protein [Ruminococcus sp.]
MRKICSCLFQVLIGIYLIFVGGYLAYRMWEERPENITWMCGIAAVFVLTGMIYLFRRAGKMLGGRKAGREAERESAEERSMEGQTKLPLRDPSIFRTAPMPVLEEEEPGRFPERKRRQR